MVGIEDNSQLTAQVDWLGVKDGSHFVQFFIVLIYIHLMNRVNRSNDCHNGSTTVLSISIVIVSLICTYYNSLPISEVSAFCCDAGVAPDAEYDKLWT